jgi:hypothetical protein
MGQLRTANKRHKRAVARQVRNALVEEAKDVAASPKDPA